MASKLRYTKFALVTIAINSVDFACIDKLKTCIEFC